jgi:L-ascorbate metabolism protein UlaG (beta-lactamase superfamily)
MVSPITAGLQLKARQLAILDSYLDNPRLHTEAISDPHRMAGPFLDPQSSSHEQLAEFRSRVVVEAKPLLAFAADIEATRKLLREQGDGRPLTELYARLPPSLRGLVELVYDDQQQPSMRFFESLVYRGELYPRQAQEISLLAEPDLAQPFIFNSPLLTDARRVDVRVPFDSPLLDELYAARLRPAPVAELADKLAVAAGDRDRFAALFTDAPPPGPLAAPQSGVRMRYLGHAGVLLESPTAAVLLDPIAGYAGDGIDHLGFTDLPAHVDVVVLSHAHADHVGLETLLQLRARVGTVVVPGGSGGTVVDPGLAPMLRALGFRTVVALADMESHAVGDVCVTAVPFLGEHGDLDIRAKMVPMVQIDGRRFLFATDTVLIAPELYQRVGAAVKGIDALFIGLECVGAPMSWLYGPLLGVRPRREHDRLRRLSGCDAAMASQLAEMVGAKRVYSYAMGLEPWLRHITGSVYDPDSEQVGQSRKLDELCAGRGVPSQLLYLNGEHSWP